jgi:hypothetical protein
VKRKTHLEQPYSIVLELLIYVPGILTDSLCNILDVVKLRLQCFERIFRPKEAHPETDGIPSKGEFSRRNLDALLNCLVIAGTLFCDLVSYSLNKGIIGTTDLFRGTIS